jgi:hypothetical protein
LTAAGGGVSPPDEDPSLLLAHADAPDANDNDNEKRRTAS